VEEKPVELVELAAPVGIGGGDLLERAAGRSPSGRANQMSETPGA